MNKLISVIVPIYNVEKYLEVCLDSLINQTYSNLEIILVDDGSPDNCPKICDEYAKKDKRIKVIHKKNGGLSDARNAGLDIASGDYIYFVDSDDYLNYNCIELLYNALVNNDADISACNVLDVEEKCSEQKSINKDFDFIMLDNISACKRCKKSSNDNIGVVVWNKLYKKNIFDNIRFEKGLIHEDEAIIYQLVFPCEKIIYVNEYLHYYRLSSDSIMRSDFSIKRLDLLKALKIRLDYISDKNDELYQENLKRYLHLLIYYKFLAKKKLDLSEKFYINVKSEIKDTYNRIKNKNFRVYVSKYFPLIYCNLVYLKNNWRFLWK